MAMKPAAQLSRKRRKPLILPMPTVLQVSLSINLVSVVGLLYLSFSTSSGDCCIRNHVTETTSVWHGGHPAEDKFGSCWCGEDKYCMCTPNLAIDLIITSGGMNSEGSATVDSFWLVRRKDTNQLATMGGFVEVHETVEDAVTRELKEEMDLTFRETPKLVGIYSDPRRDNRRRTASVVYAVHLPREISPRAGDDAKEVVKIPIHEVQNHSYFSDHKTILLDYLHSKGLAVQHSHRTDGDFAGDIVRSTCGISNSL
jgi:8-oxo-dGTP diphosphatase